jgi:hypothetical protein
MLHEAAGSRARRSKAVRRMDAEPIENIQVIRLFPSAMCAQIISDAEATPGLTPSNLIGPKEITATLRKWQAPSLELKRLKGLR